MKKYLLPFAALLFFFSACEEQKVIIPELTGTISERKVLIEEFTGANCSACPQGSAEIKDMQIDFGEKVVAVAIHTYLSSTLGEPISGAAYDLRTNYGDEIATYLGPLTSIPAASINRSLLENQSQIIISPSTVWRGFVESELDKTPLLALATEVEYDPDSRELKVHGNIVPVEDLDGDIRIVGYITESHIIDKQLNGTEIVDDYEHNHVLREVLRIPGQTTPTIEGNPLATPIHADEVLPFEFAPFTIPDEDNGLWIAKNCHVVVFVVRFDSSTGSREVLQADEVDVVE